MKVLTVLGTRPEIIRLSIIIEKLDSLVDHVLVYTGQNYDPNLSDVFFKQLGVRDPDHQLGARGSFGQQIGTIITGAEQVLERERPDRFLVLGDTNSSLAAIAAKRAGVPVYHMEAGNRCYDDRVPEEVNRRVIDHASDVLLPYTERSRQNLLREGIEGRRVYVTGNPIYEVIRRHERQIDESSVLGELGLEGKHYVLVTMHRAENVDVPERLESLTQAFGLLHRELGLPIVVSTHPRTAERMRLADISVGDADVRFLPPFGFFEFVNLEKNAFLVLSDSGTVQEECSIFQVANVTIRDVTERPETLECGSNILSGADPETILCCARTVLALRSEWRPPAEYLVENVSDRVTKIVLGYLYR
jgi:UDP-N-acetylglucosamine 2-epimerase (non-hydrolysing)